MVLKADELDVARSRRFVDLQRHHKADGPDVTVPGASTGGRWAVLTQSTHGHGTFLNRATTREQAEEVAGANIHEGWEPVALFDLDELAGEPPVMVQAEYDGWIWDIHGDQYVSGERTGEIVLKRSDPDTRTRQYVWQTVRPDQLTNIEWSKEDDRLPVRYDVAGVRRIVAFNTVASP